jgi:hypothetical protein
MLAQSSGLFHNPNRAGARVKVLREFGREDIFLSPIFLWAKL